MKTPEEEWQESVGVDDCEYKDERRVAQLRRLARPAGPIDVVLDTDTYNEIDDQFAIAYLLQSGDRLHTRAIYAAPFDSSRCDGPSDGMSRSFGEIQRVLDMMGRREDSPPVFRGATSFLVDEHTPSVSDAARDLARRAMAYTPEAPLYVIGIAAGTNIASALLLEPRIADRIVVVWLAGNAVEWPNNREFNMRQDIPAARVIFGSDVALVQLPCMGVVSAFATTGPELDRHLGGKNELCDYLVRIAYSEAAECNSGTTWSRPIWDVTAVAWLLGQGFTADRVREAPMPEYDDRYGVAIGGRPYRYVFHIDRDRLMADLFAKLSAIGR